MKTPSISCLLKNPDQAIRVFWLLGASSGPPSTAMKNRGLMTLFESLSELEKSSIVNICSTSYWWDEAVELSCFPLLMEMNVGPLKVIFPSFCLHTAYTDGISLCFSPITKSWSGRVTWKSFWKMNWFYNNISFLT